MHSSGRKDAHAELQEWICRYLAEELSIPAGSIDPAEPMSAYGLDSVRAIMLLTDVEERVGFEIDPNALWEFPTVTSFTDLLVEQLTETAEAAG